VPVEQSSAVSTADVTSSAIWDRATAAFMAEKADTSAAPPTGGEQDDLYMADPQLTLGPQAAEVGVPMSKMTMISAYTSGPRGRTTSSPTVATSMTSRRRHARSGGHSQ
jgi:hypothetical protein